MLETNKIITAPSLLVVPNKVILYLDEKAKLFKDSKLHLANKHEVIGVMSGYDVIHTDKNCGGYCDMWNKEIAISDETMHTYLHELCHAYQADLGIWEKLSPVLSDYFKAEQQCESMAAYLYQKIYNKSPFDVFTSYMKKDSLLFLKDWYKGSFIENDIKNI